MSVIARKAAFIVYVLMRRGKGDGQKKIYCRCKLGAKSKTANNLGLEQTRQSRGFLLLMTTESILLYVFLKDWRRDNLFLRAHLAVET